MKAFKIAVLASGGGSNLQAILDNEKKGTLENCQVALVLSNKEGAKALARGKAHGAKTMVVASDQEIVKVLKENQVDLVVLAGYMKVLSEEVIKEYRGRIINIHPSLIPKYCGKGFYGEKIHKAVLDGGETQSGATCHLVDEGVDTGEILIQETVAVLRDDTPDTLAARVLSVEHKILSQGIIKIKNRRS